MKTSTVYYIGSGLVMLVFLGPLIGIIFWLTIAVPFISLAKMHTKD